MFPAISHIISPKSSQDDASTLTDAYFNEVGFKCGADNSMLGSTESPDLDAEDYTMDDRSLGLAGLGEASTLDMEEGLDHEPEILPPPSPQEMRAQAKSPFNRASRADSGSKNSKPFQSYFTQMSSPNDNAYNYNNSNNSNSNSNSNSLDYDPTNAYAIQVLRPPNSPDDDVSTLGDGSYTRTRPGRHHHYSQYPPNHPQHNIIMNIAANARDDRLPASIPHKEIRHNNNNNNNNKKGMGVVDIKKTSTGSTLEQTDTKDSDDSNNDSVSTAAAAARRWKLIYLVIGAALFLLTAACTVLAISIVRLNSNDNSNDDTTGNNNNNDKSLPGDDDEDWALPPVQSANVESRQDLLRILAIISPVSVSELSNFTSPQFLAFEWLAEDPEYFEYTTERVIQRWVLATLYHSLGAAAVSSSTRSSSSRYSISYDDECTSSSWYSTNHNDVCDEDGNLVAIHLEGAGLSGQLPFELSLLSSTLERLYLNSNAIGGTIPTEFGKLTKLARLQLTSNFIQGTIPSELGQLSNLVVLGLGRNNFNGRVPPQLGELSTLTTLGLERNQLTGEIPIEFAAMSNLEYVSLQFNKFNGTVPSNFGQLQSLESLSLHNNALTGSMPSQLCPAQSAVQTLTADCEEVDCECCTACCVGGCDGNGGLFLTSTTAPSTAPTIDPDRTPNPTTTPTMGPTASPTAISDRLDYVPETDTPSGAPTASPSSIPSDAPSTIPSDTPSTIPSDTPSQMPSTVPSESPSSGPSESPSETPSEQPSEMPSLTPTAIHSNAPTEIPTAMPSDAPSDIPTLNPTSSPTVCVPKIESDRNCYVTNFITISFDNCNVQANDWIGFFSVSDVISLIGQGNDLTLTRQDALSWSRTCGSQFCLNPRSTGTVRFGGDQIDRGNYLAYLVRGNTALATVAVRVDWNCF